MTLVGLTGGIGSGKSTVARIFETLGIPIYTADDRAKILMNHDVDLMEAIKSRFGAEVYSEEGLDRKALSDIVFQDGEALRDLNALVHPAVARDFRAWMEGLDSDITYAIKEAAILFETGGQREMDVSILVTAPEDLRIQRVMERDGVGADAVKARMAKQWPDSDKEPLADHIIINDGSHSLIEQVMHIHSALQQHWA